MGTRSLIHFYDGGHKDIILATVYQQYDGGPTVVGKDLAEFLLSGVVVNGIPVGGTARYFNGMSCLTAQYIAEHKHGAGGLYIYPAGVEDVGEEWTYEVGEDYVQVHGYGGNFHGSWQQFAHWCEDYTG